MEKGWKPPKKKLLASNLDELIEKYIQLNPIEPGIKFKLYCNSCDRLYSEGWKANDMEMTYIYWMKFATLWIEKLRYHPEFMQAEHVERKGEIQVKCLEVLNRLEKIKADLKELYLKYQMWKTRQEHLRDLLKKKVEQREQERRLQEERNQEERDDEQIILEESEDDETEDESSSSTFSSLTTWSTSTSTKSEIR